MISLVLEASTYAGSVALLDGASLLGSRSVAMRGKEHEALMAAVGELLGECGVSPNGIGRVICGAGPGSFTSLRIAAAVAKGISVATGAPLVALSSLAMLVGAREPRTSGRYLAVMDAMRGESYVQEFSIDQLGEITTTSSHSVVGSESVDTMADVGGAIAIGPARSGAELVVPHAWASANLTNMIDSSDPVDLASCEPLYGRLAEAQVKWEATHGRPLESV